MVVKPLNFRFDYLLGRKFDKIFTVENHSLNRKINQLFIGLGQQIYKNDIANDDTKGWWPIRPPLLDSLIVEFIFQELIRLVRKAEKDKVSVRALAESLGSKEIVREIQFLWPSLSWSSNEISYEDKMYLIQKLLEISELAHSSPNFGGDTFDKLAEKIKENGDDSTKNVLTTGVKIYFSYLAPLYKQLDEDWKTAESEAITIALGKTLMKDPGPWDDRGKDYAIRQVVRNCDFRRGKLKNLKQILQGEPGIPGVAVGTVGENIVVDISIPTPLPNADGFVTNADAFKDSSSKENFMDEGTVVVSRTSNGTKVLQKGQKVIIDGTSGIVYINP